MPTLRPLLSLLILAMLSLPLAAEPPADAAAELARLRAEVIKLRAEVARLRAAEAERGPKARPVVRVIDGDSIKVRFAAEAPAQEAVRMLRIDTPERGEPGFAEARTALSRLLIRRKVTLEFARGKPTRDRFGRLLAHVWLEATDDEPRLHVNLEMVRLGWARYYTDYGTDQHHAAFEAAQAEARKARRGLWALLAPAD